MGAPGVEGTPGVAAGGVTVLGGCVLGVTVLGVCALGVVVLGVPGDDGLVTGPGVVGETVGGVDG